MQELTAMARMLINTNPANWPEQDEMPEPDISDIEAVYRATVLPGEDSPE